MDIFLCFVTYVMYLLHVCIFLWSTSICTRNSLDILYKYPCPQAAGGLTTQRRHSESGARREQPESAGGQPEEAAVGAGGAGQEEGEVSAHEPPEHEH